MDELLRHGFSEDQINGGGLTITTTFDPRLQEAAVQAAHDQVAAAVADAMPLRNSDGSYQYDEAGNPKKPDPEQLHVGLASLEVGTGEVLALYGGPDYVKSSINWATTPRYAASTFKVYGMIAGLRHGFGLESRFQGSTFIPPGDDKPVSNDSGQQYGTLSLEQAAIYSANTAFVDMMSQIPKNQDELVKAAADAGVPENDSWRPQGVRMVLGQAEVSALDNATGYATLANNGMRNESHVVREVKDSSGNVIYVGNKVSSQTVEEAVARDITSALSQAAEQGQRNAVGCDVAGKTGTAGTGGQSEQGEVAATRSAWLAGYTKQIATAVVMVAGESGNENLDVYGPGGSTFYGATYPSAVWNQYMEQAVQGMECRSFDPAANIRPTVANTLAPPVVVVEETEEPSQDPSSQSSTAQENDPSAAPQPSTHETLVPQPTTTAVETMPAVIRPERPA